MTKNLPFVLRERIWATEQITLLLDFFHWKNTSIQLTLRFIQEINKCREKVLINKCHISSRMLPLQSLEAWRHFQAFDDNDASETLNLRQISFFTIRRLRVLLITLWYPHSHFFIPVEFLLFSQTWKPALPWIARDYLNGGISTMKAVFAKCWCSHTVKRWFACWESLSWK